MRIKRINSANEKLSGTFEIRAKSYGMFNTETYIWEVAFVNETIADFLEEIDIQRLYITGIRRMGDNE
jgi:hypothetical protein